MYPSTRALTNEWPHCCEQVRWAHIPIHVLLKRDLFVIRGVVSLNEGSRPPGFRAQQPIHVNDLGQSQIGTTRDDVAELTMGGSQSAEKRKASDVYEEEEIEENPNHIEIGDQNAVRNIMDDAIVEQCQQRKDYVVHYGWDNIKLLLMVLASAIAAASHFYRTPAITERTLIYACVIGFFVIHAVLLAYTVFVERDILVRMSKKGAANKTVVIKTTFPYTEPNYIVEIQYAAQPFHSVKEELYVGKYFDAEGYFDKDGLMKHFDSLLAKFEKQKTT